MTRELTPAETEELARYEGYDTFEAYCLDRWHARDIREKVGERRPRHSMEQKLKSGEPLIDEQERQRVAQLRFDDIVATLSASTEWLDIRDTLRQLCQELDEMPGTISGRVLRSWVVKQLESRPAPPEVPGEVLHDEDKLVMTRSI